jgi:hypothetical protein
MPGVWIITEEVHGTCFGVGHLTNEVRFSLTETISTALGKGPTDHPRWMDYQLCTVTTAGSTIPSVIDELPARRTSNYSEVNSHLEAG